MQQKSLVLLSVGTLLLAGLVLSIAFASRETALDMNCNKTGKAYTVVIKDDVLSPDSINAKRCDTITIINKDKTLREIGFGEHDEHKAYDGITERLISDGEQFTITLRQSGTHDYHDHFHDEVTGSFTVN
jgi:plastocyanin